MAAVGGGDASLPGMRERGVSRAVGLFLAALADRGMRRLRLRLLAQFAGIQASRQRVCLEKTRVVEVERRRARSSFRMWLDRMTRWRADIYSPGIAGRLKRMFAPGSVLDVGIPFRVEISEALSREADTRMRAGLGRAIHAPAVEGVREFPDRYFTGILLRSFLEHEKQPKELLEQCSRVLALGDAIYVRVPNFGSPNRRMVGAKRCGFRYRDHVNYFTTKSLGTTAGDCELKLKLLDPLRLPPDDNINAVLQGRNERAAIA